MPPIGTLTGPEVPAPRLSSTPANQPPPTRRPAHPARRATVEPVTGTSPVPRDHVTVSWHVIGRLDSLRREVTLTRLAPAVRTAATIGLMAVRSRVCSREPFDEAEIRTLLSNLATLVTHHPLLSDKVAGLSAELLGEPRESLRSRRPGEVTTSPQRG